MAGTMPTSAARRRNSSGSSPGSGGRDGSRVSQTASRTRRSAGVSTAAGSFMTVPRAGQAFGAVQSLRCRDEGMLSILRYFVTVRRATG